MLRLGYRTGLMISYSGLKTVLAQFHGKAEKGIFCLGLDRSPERHGAAVSLNCGNGPREIKSYGES